MPKQITFQMCINIFIYHYYGETRLYKINHVVFQIALATFYSLVSLLLGIWRIPGINTIGNIGAVWRAIKVNANGGNDYTTLMLEQEFSDEVNFIWRNLKHPTRDLVDRNTIVKILDLQEVFTSNGQTLFEKENIQFLKSKLNRSIDVQYKNADLEHVVYALKLNYEKEQKELTVQRVLFNNDNH